MAGKNGAVRDACLAADKWFPETCPSLLERQRHEVEPLFMRIGITFAIYGEGSYPERIIDADEWDRMSRDLEQRAKALNYFLGDICAEHKYGTPILYPTLTCTSLVEDVVKACLIPMNLTLRNNLSVDLLVYRWDTLEVGAHHPLDENDPYSTNRKERWS
jgi:hypothetical protein